MKKKFLQILILFSLVLLSCTSEENNKPSQETASLGEVAQISLSCINVEKSLVFYQKLDYSILEVQLEAQPPWAVISDGSQLIMLSQNEFPSPALTFYGKSLSDRIDKLQAAGLDLETISDEQGQIKSAILKNPVNLAITLIDFDPNLLLKPIRQPDFVLGNFANIKIPVSDLEEVLKFWKKTGFKTVAKDDVPYPQVLLEQAKLQIHLIQDSTLAQPALCYTHQNGGKLLSTLKNVKIDFKRVEIDQKSLLFFESPDKQLFMIELDADQTQN